MRQGRWRAIIVVLALLPLALTFAPATAAERLDEAAYRKTIELCVLISMWSVVDFSPRSKSEASRTIDPATLPEAATVTFAVRPSGDFEGLRMARSSGNAQLDAALLKAIGSKAPFLPLPAGTAAPLAFEVTLPLREDAVSGKVLGLIDDLGLRMFDAFDLAKVGTETEDPSPPPAQIPPEYEQAVMDRVYDQSGPLDAAMSGSAQFQKAMDSGKSLSLIALFTIDRKGKVLSSRIADSSGVAALDQAALDAIAQGAPYPPLPPEYHDATRTFAIPFFFRAPPEKANEGLKQDYFAAVRKHLADNLSELLQAIRYESFDMEKYGGGDLLELSVELTLARNGELESVRIPTPSGHAALDDALVRAAREAAPYPSIPRSLGIGTAIVTIKFAYSLHY